MFECSIDSKNRKIIIFYCEDVETVNKNWHENPIKLQKNRKWNPRKQNFACLLRYNAPAQMIKYQ